MTDVDGEPSPENFNMNVRTYWSLCDAAIELRLRYIELVRLLGVDEEDIAYGLRPESEDKLTSVAWVSFIKKLQGPYGAVLLRAYRAHNNLEV